MRVGQDIALEEISGTHSKTWSVECHGTRIGEVRKVARGLYIADSSVDGGEDSERSRDAAVDALVLRYINREED